MYPVYLTFTQTSYSHLLVHCEREMCLSLQLQLNYLGNYVPTAWTYDNGCGICDDNLLYFNEVPVCTLT